MRSTLPRDADTHLSNCLIIIHNVILVRTMKAHGGMALQLHLFLTLRRLMLYIYGAPILDVSRSHTTTQHSR